MIGQQPADLAQLVGVAARDHDAQVASIVRSR
jgi:hypothetical protein